METDHVTQKNDIKRSDLFVTPPIDRMAQAQIDAHFKDTKTTAVQGCAANHFFIDTHPMLTLKIWKRKLLGLCVTLYKKGTTKYITIPYEAWQQLVDSQDVVELAAKFVEGTVEKHDDEENQVDDS